MKMIIKLVLNVSMFLPFASMAMEPDNIPLLEPTVKKVTIIAHDDSAQWQLSVRELQQAKALACWNNLPWHAKAAKHEVSQLERQMEILGYS